MLDGCANIERIKKTKKNVDKGTQIIVCKADGREKPRM